MAGLPARLALLMGKSYPSVIRAARPVQPEIVSQLLSATNLDKIEAMLASRPRADLTTLVPRRAGILLPLCFVDNVPSVIFTVKDYNLRSHAGDVSFPGGRMDETDKDIQEAALRETEEEIALPRTQIRILGLWDDMVSKSKDTAVTPVVGYCGHVDLTKLVPNPGEVHSIFAMSLATLLDPAKRQIKSTRTGNVPMPTFEGGPEVVWGLTAYVLAGFLNELVDSPAARL
eukprot:m.45770 g.45770  ORF g.45770 m.45770 type:complete len:230 (-) comp12474_c0_seq3:238-927(-)